MFPWLKKSVGRAELSKPLPRSESLEKLCRVFEAHAERSPRKFTKRTRLDYTDYNDPNVHYTVEEIDAVAIHIPIHRVDEFLNIVDEQTYKELYIRNEVPAVKKAYEHYRMLLRMCGGDSAGY
jgi:hypothetical protein